ncbi:MAG: TlpA family protein disulfide reductase [Aquabacterium sp.]|nr:MAG: TlpA family protein disulfide reductase [Aquabacterium sp.]
MRRQLQTIVMIAGSLWLAACGEDYGTDQHGRMVSAAQLQDRWLVINYWAEWCGPCRKEVPELNTLAASRTDLVVLGVNYDGLQGEELLKASEQLGIRYSVLAIDPAERLKLPRSDALPSTYLIDPEGRVRDQLLGEQTSTGLQARLAQLQQEE